MAKRATLKLKKALDRHQRKDYSKIKQQKLQKTAEKRKSGKKPADGEEEGDGSDEEDDVLVTGDNEGDEIDGAEVDAFLKSLGGEDGLEGEEDDGEEWATEDDEEEEGEDDEEGGVCLSEWDRRQRNSNTNLNDQYDMSRLEDSDSDISDSELDEPQPEKKSIAPSKASKVIAPTPAAKHSKQQGAAATTTAADDEDEDASDSDEEEEEEDIPLSDIESLGSNSDEADIIPHQRLTINNTTSLTRALESFALPLSTLAFSEHQSITTSAPTEIADVEDDLSRELAFYAQSLSAAKEARLALRKEGFPFTRPADFFAEMVKSDEHMGKIKAKLLDDATSKKASADARRQRDLKKFGKQVQQEKLKERAKEKKDMLDKVKVLKRKRQGEGLAAETEGDLFDVALDDEVKDVKSDRRESSGRGGRGGRGGDRGHRGGRSDRGGRDGGDGGPNAKRARKNDKYGFGGKKRFGKSGDAESSADMSGFSTKRMKDSGGRGGRGGRGGARGGGVKKFTTPRMGKSKRENRR